MSPCRLDFSNVKARYSWASGISLKLYVIWNRCISDNTGMSGCYRCASRNLHTLDDSRQFVVLVEVDQLDFRSQR